MKGEKWKWIFSRENVVFSLIPVVGACLVLLASIILSALSVLNGVVNVCLWAAAFIFLAWLIFGTCYLSLRGKSGKKKVARIVFIVVICIFIICGALINTWVNAVYNQIEQLRAMVGSAEWSAAMAEELTRAESLYEILRSAILLVYLLMLFVLTIGMTVLQNWRSEGTEHPPQTENPPQSDID